MRQEQTSGRNITSPPTKKNPWLTRTFNISRTSGPNAGEVRRHTGVLWNLLLDRRPHREMPTETSRGNLGGFSIRPLESSVRIQDGLVARSFPFPASCAFHSHLSDPSSSALACHPTGPPSRTSSHPPHLPTITQHMCVCNIHRHAHTCLRSWLASSWQKALSLEATQPPPLFSQDFHLCRLALLATVHLSFLDASLHPPGSQKMTGKAGRSPAHSLPVPKAGTLQS